MKWVAQVFGTDTATTQSGETAEAGQIWLVDWGWDPPEACLLVEPRTDDWGDPGWIVMVSTGAPDQALTAWLVERVVPGDVDWRPTETVDEDYAY